MADNTVKFGDTFYLKHATNQYLVAVDRGTYNWPQLGNTGKVTLQLVGNYQGEVVRSQSRIKIKTTELATGNNDILGAFSNSHDCYYWQDGYDENKQSWLIAKISGQAGSISYGEQVYLINCSYTNQKLCADTSSVGYITTAENTQDWWILESTVPVSSPAPSAPESSSSPTASESLASQPATAPPNVAPSPPAPTQPSDAPVITQVGGGSTYQETCTKISVKGNVLSATCKKGNGSSNKTSIVLMGIENIDGELKVTDPNKPSSYQETCTEISIKGNVLSATCKKADGSPNKTSIVLDGIENIDGNLTYTGTSVAPSPPAPSEQTAKATAPSQPLQSVLDFEGGDYVDYGNPAHLNLTTQITIEAWICPKQTQGWLTIVNKWSDSGYYLGLNPEGVKLRWNIGIGSYDSASGVAVGSWTHVAATYDGSVIKVYLNGIEQASAAIAGAIKVNQANFQIAKQSNTDSNYFVGSISDVRIWNIARTQSEIQATINRRLTGTEAGLVGYWSLDEGSGNTAHDKTPAANHGTIQGSVNWVTSDLPNAPVESVQPTPIEQPAIPNQPATASPNVAPSPSTVPPDQLVELIHPIPSEQSAIPNQSASAPPNVAPIPPAPTALEANPSATPAPAIAPPIPPVRLQGSQMVLVLDDKHQGISAGGGALRPQGNFTIEVWVYPATNAGKQVIFADGETLFYLEGGELKFQTPLSSEAIASVGAGIASGSWYHVAVTRAGSRPGNTKLYINGVHNDNQKAISPVLSFGNTYLGGQPNVADSRFQGKLLEVRIWRYARSQAEIEANKMYPLTGRELGLVRYWSLNQTVGSTLEDKTTNRAVGTLSGNAVWEEAEIPLKLKLDAQERLTRSTGLEDYGYWFKEMAKQQKTQADPPFRRGRIWR